MKALQNLREELQVKSENLQDLSRKPRQRLMGLLICPRSKGLAILM